MTSTDSCVCSGEQLSGMRASRVAAGMELADSKADYLSPKYHVVVANPPYMGGKGMSPRLASWLRQHFANVKSDLFSAFIVRNKELCIPRGQLGFMTPFVWMFIATYEKLRDFILDEATISSLVQLEYSGFDGATVPICTFTLENSHKSEYRGAYIRLSDFRGSHKQAPKTLEAIANPDCGWFYRASAREFKRISGKPIAYWATPRVRMLFQNNAKVGDVAELRTGMHTGDNPTFLRYWHEVSQVSIGFGMQSAAEACDSGMKWFPYNKGGSYRKWFGNNEYLVNWQYNGAEIHAFHNLPLDYNGAPVRAKRFQFLQSITWTATSSSYFGVRHSDPGFLFDVKGSSGFCDDELHYPLLGYLATPMVSEFLQALNPTIEFQNGNLKVLPLIPNFYDRNFKTEASYIVQECVAISRRDWDSFESSWEFASSPLLPLASNSLQDSFQSHRDILDSELSELRAAEQRNNELFIHAYGMSNEVDSQVPLDAITLTANPHYRYGSDKSESDLEALLLADTMREFISYAVGCMLGRYSLDKPGLILANQGETTDDYLLKVSNQTEPLDEDRAISEPDSVVFVTGAAVACFSCGDTVPTDEAAFVISEYEQGATPLRGRPLIYCSNCAEGPQASYVTWQQPLAKFSVRQALMREWCEPNTLKKFISMAGCFGHRVPADPDEISFMPDDDNVIPLLDGDWFTDDISQRFKEFLKVTFGTEHYDENLTFLENALYPDNLTGRKRKTIRDYFLKEFYNHHVKLYKKRPIYWLFSSPKGTFNALIYMHRYRPDTVSVVLSYLRDFRDKLTHHTAHLQSVADRADGSKSDKTKALKQINEFKKQLKELDDYERTTLFPLAQKQIPIDLDDGVKVNYPKFGAALKKIPGLEKVEA